MHQAVARELTLCSVALSANGKMGTVATRCDIGVAVFPLFPGFGQHAGPSIVRTVCIKLPCFYFSGWSHFYGDTHGLQGGEGLCVCKTCEWQWDRRRVGKGKKNEEGGWCKFCGAPPHLVNVWETKLLTVRHKAGHFSVALQTLYQTVVLNLSQYKLFIRKQQPLAFLLHLPTQLFLAATQNSKGSY